VCPPRRATPGRIAAQPPTAGASLHAGLRVQRREAGKFTIMSLKNTTREEVYFRDKYICKYCGENLLNSVEKWHLTEVDHIVPKGGDDPQNLVVACRSCNMMKVGCDLNGISNQDEAIKRIKAFIEERKRYEASTIDGLRKWISQKDYIKPHDFKRTLEAQPASAERLNAEEQLQLNFENISAK
jgi:HNH endonuclease